MHARQPLIPGDENKLNPETLTTNVLESGLKYQDETVGEYNTALSVTITNAQYFRPWQFLLHINRNQCVKSYVPSLILGRLPRTLNPNIRFRGTREFQFTYLRKKV